MLTAAEQLLLELVNRARLDPGAEAVRTGIELNAGLDPDTLDGTPRQPLAPNPLLTQAAREHGDWLIASDAFSHTGLGGSSPSERVTAAGYDFFTTGENLALYRVLPGPVDGDAAIAIHHQGLFESPGHRTNMLVEDFREAGIGQSVGPWVYEGRSWSASIAVEKFAATGTDAFLTGVAFVDADGDGTYDIGEGSGEIAVSAPGSVGLGGGTQTASGSGGYAISVGDARGWTEIGLGAATLRIRLDGENAKLDHVETADGVTEIRASVDLDLVSGVARAVLLGAGDLALTGGAGHDRLAGNPGANALGGGQGNDTLTGGAGHDSLRGEAGDDLAVGGDGEDLLIGARGDDHLRGGHMADRLEGGAGGDLLRGGLGPDEILGGDGADRLFGEAGDDRLDGAAGRDLLLGGAGRDTLFGGAGDDLLRGGAQGDTLQGDAGRDALTGGAGDDSLDGGAGADVLHGGRGEDSLAGGAGPDLLTGGAGADSFVFTGDWGRDRINDFDPAEDLVLVDEGEGAADFRDALTDTAAGALYDAGADGLNTILFDGHDAETLAALTVVPG